MIENDVRIIEWKKQSNVKAQKITLDFWGELVYLFSTKDDTFSDLFQNKILDTLLDKIGSKNPYKDFSRWLELLNAFLESWDTDKKLQLNALVWLYDGKSFHFSTIWEASAYLWNIRWNLVEVSDKDDYAKTFHFISSGDVWEWETLILSSIRLLSILSKDDIEDGLGTKYIRSTWENIEHILHIENIDDSVACISMRVWISSVAQRDSRILQAISYYFYKSFDNSLSKKLLGYVYHVRDSILRKQKHTVQIIFGLWMLLSIFVIYNFISGVFTIASKSQNVVELQDSLLEARDFFDSASQNINNLDAYELYYNEADIRLSALEEKNVFVEDVQQLRENMLHLESQVNFTQTFEPTWDYVHHIFSDERDVVQLVRTDSWRLYAVHERSVTWPIIRSEVAENYVYNALSANDRFIDATTVWNEIIIQTEAWNVISFWTNNRFSIVNVTRQDTWFRSPLVRSFNQNLYTISEDRTQLYMHRRSWSNYNEWIPYLSDDDVATIWSIQSIGIDGWIYLLKDDWMFLKFFREPYRVQSLTLNRLPRNYIPLVTDPSNRVDMIASASYRHVYVLIGTRLFVFEPNSRRPTDTQSLRFMWQIESQTSDIQAFYIVSDGDVFLADSRGVYRVWFDIEDFWVRIRQ